MPSHHFIDPDSREHYDALESAFIDWQRIEQGPASYPPAIEVNPINDFLKSVAACHEFIRRGVSVQVTQSESQARSILGHFLWKTGWSKIPELVDLLGAYVRSGHIDLNAKTYGFAACHRRCNTEVTSSYALEAAIDRGNFEAFKHMLRLGANPDLKPSVDWSSDEYLGPVAYGSSEAPATIRDTIWGLPNSRDAGPVLQVYLIANDMHRQIDAVKAAGNIQEPIRRRADRVL